MEYILGRMKTRKRLLHNDGIRSILCFLISLYMRLVYHTSKWEIINAHILNKYERDSNAALFMFWHGRLFVMPHICQNSSRFSVIISRHVDGELIARTMGYFGLGVIRGSSDRGGNQVIREVIKTLRSGKHVAITPDGPRGPRMCINSNVVAIAKMTGAPIVPVTFSAANGRIFQSWDRFLLPKPFGKGVVICGQATFIPKDATPEELNDAKRALEEELNTMSHKADKMVGITPVMPEDRNAPPKKRKVTL